MVKSAALRPAVRERDVKPSTVVDTFPAFEKFWKQIRTEPVSQQLDRWEHEYMAPWPELLSKQIESYAADGVDWRRVARRRVFPHLGPRLARMRGLHRDLTRSLPSTWASARKVLGLRLPVRFVIYVGIGCGAGWATIYEGEPACLFGLENAAENHLGGDGWSRCVVAHELGHLAHQEWRKERWETDSDPWWSLYEEGFATHCERQVEPRWFRLRTGRRDWLPWCEKRRAWLARRFLRDVSAHRSVRPYFGSWYSIQGRIETGYYLGSEVIREWTKESTLHQVATLSRADLRHRARATLVRFAGSSMLEVPTRDS